MTIVILIYILLLITFMVISSLVFRHTVKFGYLSPAFKTVVITFGIISLCIIVFSIYLMFQTGESNGGGYNYSNSYSEPAPTSTGDLNF